MASSKPDVEVVGASAARAIVAEAGSRGIRPALAVLMAGTNLLAVLKSLWLARFAEPSDRGRWDAALAAER